MSFKKGLATLLLGVASLVPSACSPLECLADDVILKKKQSVKEIRDKADQLWIKDKKDEAIKLYMSLPTCNDILGDKVKYVKYDKKTRTNNFDRLVYQKHLAKKERKPVLVLFYHDIAPRGAPPNTSKRTAIVFSSFTLEYREKIEFVACERNSDPRYICANRLNFFKNYGLKSTPSLALYSPWDILNKENQSHHDGIITRIDLLQGGVRLFRQIKNWSKDFPVWWLEPNLYKKPTPDGDGKLYRFMGTGDYLLAGTYTPQSGK